MKDVWIFEVTHLDLKLESARVPIEGTQTDAGHFKPTVWLQQKVKAGGVDRVRGYYLSKRCFEASLQEVLEVLQVADLTGDLKSFAICRPSLIEHSNGLVWVVNSLIEDQVGADGQTGTALSSFAVDSYHAHWVIGQIQHLIQDKFKHLQQWSWVVVHKWKIGDFDLVFSQRENFWVHEIIVAHVVNLNSAVVVFFEELDDVVLAVTEQLVEPLAWQPHGYHSIGYVAQI